ncbi:MAG: cupin domain-containing protein [Chloroflexota bacterium]|nr:cupin domain-containing protein [Chloroflexota bacterium]
MATKGIIRELSEIKAVDGQVGHEAVHLHRLLKPDKAGPFYMSLTLDAMPPGAVVEPHYHTDCEVFDHAFYVASGKIAVRVGDEERVVGPDTVIWCPSNMTHSLKNVGKTKARVLRIGASGKGDFTCKTVYPGN